MERKVPDDDLLIQLTDQHPEFYRLRTELAEAKSLGSVPRIAVCGLMNAGKSALLNGLTGHIETEVFETKEIRATTQLQTLDHEGRLYLDTPGIDACDEDDRLAWLGLANADVILFVHNLRTATLEQIETAFLSELKRRRPDLERHLVVVLTHVESVTQREVCEQAIGNILQSLFGTVPATFATSFSTLRNGVRKGSAKLLELSGFDPLREHLQAHPGLLERGMSKQRAERDDHRRDALEHFFDLQIAQRRKRLVKLEGTQTAHLEILQSSVERLFESVSHGLARG
ncbi:GTPase [Pseudomonas sp. PB103]|jgi:tRNA U34 5-carboxymethylaminomethyl modifying GTPase MnmE/TrmE|uniref:GTPase n=1 Tax=Pseudomonas sp. PB103 TaxID=2494698 RepID=UPI00131E5CBC|nr:GTPase [Pseudomonas sp. PB103]